MNFLSNLRRSTLCLTPLAHDKSKEDAEGEGHSGEQALFLQRLKCLRFLPSLCIFKLTGLLQELAVFLSSYPSPTIPSTFSSALSRRTKLARRLPFCYARDSILDFLHPRRLLFIRQTCRRNAIFACMLANSILQNILFSLPGHALGRTSSGRPGSQPF
ncbi:hypothetical protein DL96DRAFT_1631526 [Flagelloscypha sp. PMI_526]|nr:hypothetical protein DL96DRAFT_1631526 [Flagelloscypha sp. PMI_526]